LHSPAFGTHPKGPKNCFSQTPSYAGDEQSMLTGSPNKQPSSTLPLHVDGSCMHVGAPFGWQPTKSMVPRFPASHGVVTQEPPAAAQSCA
jgi:hypothetical protein